MKNVKHLKSIIFLLLIMTTTANIMAKGSFFGKSLQKKIKETSFKSQIATPGFKYSNISIILGTATITCSATGNVVVTVTNTATNTNTATGTTTQTCSSTSILGTQTITLLNLTCTVSVTNTITQTTSPTATATATNSSTFTCTTITPNAPSNLSVTPVLQSKMNLAWTDNSNNESGFVIYRSLDNLSFEKIATLAENITKYTDVGLLPNTKYYYNVAAVISVGPPQASNTANATTFALKVPSTFTATGKNISQIETKWTKNVEALKYEIWTSLTGNNDFVKVAEVDSSQNLFLITKLRHSSIYFVKMRTKYATGLSDFTPVVNAATKTLVLTASSNSINKVNLNWNSDTPDDLGFKILVSENANGPFVALANKTGVHASNFVHENLLINFTYYYQISPDYGNGVDQVSNTASAKTVEFKAPTITLAKGLTESSIELKWTPTTDAEYYKVYRKSAANAEYVEIIQLFGTTSLIDQNLDACGKYYYLVSAHYKNLIKYSNELIGNTQPAAPKEFIANGDGNLKNEVLLTWKNGCTLNNNLAIDHYILERSFDGINYTFAANLNGAATQYKDGPIENNISYFYRLKAISSEGTSAYVYATAKPAPLAPTNISAKGIKSSQIEVTWTDNSSDETYFLIEVANDDTFSQTQKLKAEANKQSYIVQDLQPSRVYYFRVTSFREFDNLSSGITNTANGKTCPATATNLTALNKSSSEVNLSWVDNAPDESATKIEISTDGTMFTSLGEVLANTTAYSATGLKASTNYYFRVFTRNSDGCVSEASNVVKILTLPAAPSGLKGIANSLSEIKLDWTDNSTVETGFALYQAKSNDTEFLKVQELPANAVVAVVKNLTPGTNYKFKVATIANEGLSAFSNVLEIATQTITANEEKGLEKAIILFPNPVKNILTFKSDLTILGKNKVTIRSLSGKQLTERYFDSILIEKDYSINIEDLPEGLYLFEIKNAKEHVIKKFLKKL
jgi:Fibronectin type III domain/Secretion system C-terminal sorting domain